MHVILLDKDYKSCRNKVSSLQKNTVVVSTGSVLARVREDMPRRPALDRLRDMVDAHAPDVRWHALALAYLEGGIVVAMGRVTDTALADIRDMLTHVQNAPAHPVFAFSADLKYAVCMAPRRSDPRIVAEIMTLGQLDHLFINIDNEAQSALSKASTGMDYASWAWLVLYVSVFLGTVIAGLRMWHLRNLVPGLSKVND